MIMNKHTTATKRVQLIRNYLAEHDIDLAIISSYANRRFLTFLNSDSGYVFITQKDFILMTDRRYMEQARIESEGVCRIIEPHNGRFQGVRDILSELGHFKRVLMEDTIELGEYLAIKDCLGDVEVKTDTGFFFELRAIKEDEDMANVKSAIACSDRVFARLIPQLKVGMTERDIADDMHYFALKEGADSLSFPTIVATGERSAMAHATPSKRAVSNGDFCVIDFGVFWNGYSSDTTRTIQFGEVSAEQQRIFDLVYKAQNAAIDKVADGVPANDVEMAHRMVFREAGMEAHALRGLGHGIGLQVWEGPGVVMNTPVILKTGMVFTCEPGLYIDGFCGVRIEDDVEVTDQGHEILTKTPRIIKIG